MRWPTYWKDVVTRYRVAIQGWPQDVPFRNLSDVSNLQKLEVLLRGWQNGDIYFRRLSDEEFEALSAERMGGDEGGDDDVFSDNEGGPAQAGSSSGVTLQHVGK